MKSYRKEKDCIGELDVPSDCYYGCQTLRAVTNYNITGTPISRYPEFIRSLAWIKKAAALANNKLGLLDTPRSTAITNACDDLIGGRYHEHFPVDVIQGGAGTSSNMNANEVVANRACEYLGYPLGNYDVVHPNNHVNMSQSTNDVYPTALRLTLYSKIGILLESMRYLSDKLHDKSQEFTDVVKMGRTQMQDAVPMTLGQEFLAWSIMVNEDLERVKEARSLICEINMGATAIGTGLNAPEGYSSLVTKLLQEVSGIPVESAPNLVEATQDTGAYVQLSGVLKRVAVKLSKICNDLRLLSSGPRCGFNEINLPGVAPGSSIMPGKVNPVIPEVVNQVAFKVVGADITVTMAAEAGQLELNAMEPVIAHSLFESINILGNACTTLADRCIIGITANRDRCRQYVTESIGLITAVCPYLGYETATEVAADALRTGKTVYDLVLERKLLSREELDNILSPENMIAPKIYPNIGRQVVEAKAL